MSQIFSKVLHGINYCFAGVKSRQEEERKESQCKGQGAYQIQTFTWSFYIPQVGQAYFVRASGFSVS